MNDIAAIQRRHSIPGIIAIAVAAGGLPAIAVTTPRAEATIYLHGAHVTHFQPRGKKPLLFTSSKSFFAPGKAIRGGIPVIFPWFGPHKTDSHAPSHGFARTMPWTLTSTGQNSDGSASIGLGLRGPETSTPLWPHAFELNCKITVSDSLTLELTVRNPGSAPFTFDQALHSYFAVEEVRQVAIEGLANRDYLDKTQNMRRFRQSERDLKISAETDRHYLATPDTVTIHDPAAGRDIRIAKENSQVTVVWNPGIEKAKAMSDLGGDEWQKFVCVETANAYDYAVQLPPGAEQTMTARIS